VSDTLPPQSDEGLGFDAVDQSVQRVGHRYASSEQMSDVDDECSDEWAVNQLFDLDVYPVASPGRNGKLTPELQS
jgi:hypothetical protein